VLRFEAPCLGFISAGLDAGCLLMPMFR
jgi:hypothetical protein